MEIELGRKLEVLAEKNNAFRESYNTFIKDTNQLKDYIKRSQGDESISFSENGNDFVVHTECIIQKTKSEKHLAMRGKL